MANHISPSFPRLVQEFFTEYLVVQRNLSAHTVSSYRDTFRLLLRYLEEYHHKRPSRLNLKDLDAPLILAFLDHIESQRGNAIRSRNVRLAAIRTFFRYATHHDLGALQTIQRVQAIPTKRYDRPLLGFLTPDEMQAILDAPNRATWSGARDHAMWAMFYNTGARVSEVTAMCMGDLDLEQGPCIRIRGKGRKRRAIPLWKTTQRVLIDWRRRTHVDPEAPLFPNRTGHRMTRTGVEDRLRRSVRGAADRCPSLKDRNVSPHILRHTTAMHLLRSGVDITVIALWLGHESPDTTHQYVEADIEMKRKTLDAIREPDSSDDAWQPTDDLLRFLDSL